MWLLGYVAVEILGGRRISTDRRNVRPYGRRSKCDWGINDKVSESSKRWKLHKIFAANLHVMMLAASSYLTNDITCEDNKE